MALYRMMISFGLLVLVTDWFVYVYFLQNMISWNMIWLLRLPLNAKEVLYAVQHLYRQELVI